ncbi:unnamed protein product [Arctogadus glacialis]
MDGHPGRRAPDRTTCSLLGKKTLCLPPLQLLQNTKAAPRGVDSISPVVCSAGSPQREETREEEEEDES